MHSLREQVAVSILRELAGGHNDDDWKDAYLSFRYKKSDHVIGQLELDVEGCSYVAIDTDALTSRILALIAEAMLSEEAVDSVAWSLWCVNGVDSEQYEETHYPVAREAITAALQSAGITGAGQEGGEGDGPLIDRFARLTGHSPGMIRGMMADAGIPTTTGDEPD